MIKSSNAERPDLAGTVSGRDSGGESGVVAMLGGFVKVSTGRTLKRSMSPDTSFAFNSTGKVDSVGRAAREAQPYDP